MFSRSRSCPPFPLFSSRPEATERPSLSQDFSASALRFRAKRRTRASEHALPGVSDSRRRCALPTTNPGPSFVWDSRSFIFVFGPFTSAPGGRRRVQPPKSGKASTDPPPIFPHETHVPALPPRAAQTLRSSQPMQKQATGQAPMVGPRAEDAKSPTDERRR